MAITKEELKKHLGTLNDPNGETLENRDAILRLDIDEVQSSIVLELSLSETGTDKQRLLQREIVRLLKITYGFASVKISYHTDVIEPIARPIIFDEESPTQFISIISGKGGVGKSSVTVNLAASFARQGKSVGILDADIYGYSIPTLLGLKEQVEPGSHGTFLPVRSKEGIFVMSMGWFAPNNEAILWKGPMLSKMLHQFLYQTQWPALDILLIDMPPGTGDIAMEIHHLIPKNYSSILVTTPSLPAATVAIRAGQMTREWNIPLLGVVENMSYYELPTGDIDPIFGTGGGDVVATSLQAKVLTTLAINTPRNRKTSIYESTEENGQRFDELAHTVLKQFT